MFQHTFGRESDDLQGSEKDEDIIEVDHYEE